MPNALIVYSKRIVILLLKSIQLNSNSNDLPVSSCMTPHTSNTVPLFMKQNSNKDMTDKTPTMTASPTNTVAALK